MPERIQLRRTGGWRLPPGAVSVGRPTRWGNPFAYRTAAGVIRLSGPGHAVARAFAAQDPRFDETPVLNVSASSADLPTAQCALVRVRDARTAEELALLLERLATATPRQMRDLAAQVRAAKAAFGVPDAG